MQEVLSLEWGTEVTWQTLGWPIQPVPSIYPALFGTCETLCGSWGSPTALVS